LGRRPPARLLVIRLEIRLGARLDAVRFHHAIVRASHHAHFLRPAVAHALLGLRVALAGVAYPLLCVRGSDGSHRQKQNRQTPHRHACGLPSKTTATRCSFCAAATASLMRICAEAMSSSRFLFSSVEMESTSL